jgi:hypothetical protein
MAAASSSSSSSSSSPRSSSKAVRSSNSSSSSSHGLAYAVNADPPPDLNKNTSWFYYPGVWTTYISIVFFGWLLVLSLCRCSSGSAWSIVHLIHFAVGRLISLSLSLSLSRFLSLLLARTRI